MEEAVMLDRQSAGTRLAAVVMASGDSRRFGQTDKLLMPVKGCPMLAHVLRALPMPLFWRRVVVTRNEAVADLAVQEGFEPLFHSLPDVSDTIRLGVTAVRQADGCLFSVGDQPFLTAATVERLARRFADAPDAIVRVCYGERDGNPVVFPKALFDELASLQPGQTGSAVIRRHAGCLVRCQAEHARELWDVDTREDYCALEARGEG